VWSLLRTRRWVAFTALVIIAIVGFGLLSRWQWQRADEERAKRQAWATQAEAAPIGLAGAITSPIEWTPVTTAGTFDIESTRLVRQRPLDGRNGFWVVTALDTDLGRIWVNRGWIPVTGSATGVVTAPTPPVGPVVVEGRIRLADTGDEPAPTDLPAGQIPNVSPEALGADITDFYIEATASDPADPDVTKLPAPAIDETQNVSYAVQWLIFAAIAMTGWWYFLRREAREDAEQADEVA
jgi:cytochrome oxidase assembly protein ShyY1